MSIRRQNFVLTTILLLLVGVGLLSCQAEQSKPSKIVVVFADVSASVKDFDVYHDSWSKILSRLEGGDRIVLGKITDETFTRFRPVIDETVPGFSWLTDNKLRYEKKIKEIKEKLLKALDEALAAPRSQKTDILNTLTLAEKVFHGDKRRRVLVLLSDMLEDSEVYNFERLKLAEDFTRRVIEEKRRKGEMPDLGKAKVYVAGASAKSASRALEVQRFWIEYIKAANGNLAPQNYGPALINFDE